MIDPLLTGKVGIVTGTDNPQGIGISIARSLSAQGVSLLLTFLERPPPPKSLNALEAAGIRVVVEQADLSLPATPAAIFDRAEEALGPVDVLVNNACSSGEDSFAVNTLGARDWAGRALEPLSAATHDHHFDLNSRAVALMMHELGSRHRRRESHWGRIVNISTGGAFAFPGEISYGASKWAMESYSRAAALELAPLGITVNVVAPGAIQTGWIPNGLEAEVARPIPLGRLGNPEDVADVVTFLASHQARWLTGQVIHAGGGHKM
jgi:3-oxoacyl-[acyl-carrier protein] reductase